MVTVVPMKDLGGSSPKLGDLLGYHGWQHDDRDDGDIRHGGNIIGVHDKKLTNSLLEAVDEDHAKFLTRLRQRMDSQDSWTVKVRIIRLWKLTYKLEMVLLDEKGGKIQGTIKHNLVPQFRNALQEDDVVVLTKFGVAEMTDKFPVIEHQYKINFYKCTNIQRVSGFNGHPYGFRFVGFDGILQGNMDKALTVDVIGNVIWSGDLELFCRDEKQTKRLNLDIEDLDGKVLRCTLWEGYAQKLNTFFSEHQSNEHVVVIIQHGKIKTWLGKKSIQNDMFGTRIFINEDIEEINMLQKSLILKHSETSTSQSRLSSQTVYPLRNEFIVNTERKFVDEIRETQEESVCAVLGTIRSVEEDYGWFYPACPKCKKKVVSKHDYFAEVEDVSNEYEEAPADSVWCIKCKSRAYSVIPRFKVQVRVQDTTGSVSFLLFDKEVTRIVGLTASEIRERQLQSGDMENFPRELAILVNKQYIFKIEISEFNLTHNWHVYTVQKLCDDPAIVAEMIGNNSAEETPEACHGEVCSVKLSDDSQHIVDSNSKFCCGLFEGSCLSYWRLRGRS